MKSRLVTLALIILVLCAGCALSSVQADTFVSPIYLPLIEVATAKSLPPTVIPPTPLPTPTPSPQWIYFVNYPWDTKMKGFWTNTTWRTSLTDSFWGDTYYPQGIFMVVFMDVINCGMSSDYVSRYSFQAGLGRNQPRFDMASLEVQWAAEDEYNREGVYYDLQPTFTYHLVFVFDVPAQGAYGLWHESWNGMSSLVRDGERSIYREKASEERKTYLKMINKGESK